MFMLLIFQADDAVMHVQTLRVPDLSEAIRTAQITLGTLPGAVGFQVWQSGVCVASTYPRSRRHHWLTPHPSDDRHAN